MIKIWLYIDLIAFCIAMLRSDSKNIFDSIMLDFRNEFYIQGLFFILILLIYLPFTIPFSIIKIIKERHGK